MAKLVLFEVSEHEWYVFLDVERVVKSAGAIISTVNDFENIDEVEEDKRQAFFLSSANRTDLYRGLIKDDVLDEIIWYDLKPNERNIMKKLLVSYDILMELDGGSSRSKLYGVPALFRSGHLDQGVGSKPNDLELHVVSRFHQAIPVGTIERLMAFLHRELSPKAPSPSLVRQNASVINIAGKGKASVHFNRRRSELFWVFRSKEPVALARLCIKNLELLFDSAHRRVNAGRAHSTLAHCSSCDTQDGVEMILHKDWILDEASPASGDISLPITHAFCVECDTEGMQEDTEWRRAPKQEERNQPRNSKRRMDRGCHERCDIFISHAGEDKGRVAEPLHRALSWWGLNCFLDFKSIRMHEESSASQMIKAMKDARIGIFILSPEFATKGWPMFELRTFLERVENRSSETPYLLPVFFRLSADECKSFFNSINWFFRRHTAILRSSKFVQQHINQHGSTTILRDDLHKISSDHPGVNSYREEDRRRTRLDDGVIIQNIVDTILKHAHDHGIHLN